jgi:neurofibromin 1
MLQERIWQVWAGQRGHFMDIMINELLQSAVDAGFGSIRGDCIADIIVTMASTSVRSRVFTKLRKVG